MKNRFAGRCWKCSKFVPEGAGEYLKIGGRSAVACAAHMTQESAGPIVIRATVESPDVVFQPSGQLGDRFDAYRNACAGGTYEKPGKYRCPAAVARLALERLAAAGFPLDAAPAVRALLDAQDAAAREETERAAKRADEVDAILKGRGQSLYGYQREGIAWLASRDGRGGLIADDMGLGKSLQLLATLPEGGRAVLVCPAVAKSVWLAETKKWRPDLRATVLEGRGSFRWPEPHEIVVTNYDILPPAEGDFPALAPELAASLPRGVTIIADEAHALASAKSQRTKNFRALSSAVRKAGGTTYLATATPIKSKPPELWAVLQAGGLAQEAFGTYENFEAQFHARKGRFATEWGEPSDEVPALLQKVSLRRRKTDVLKDLPPKRYRTVEVEVSRSAAKLADKALAEIEKKGGIEQAVVKLGAGLPGFEGFSEARAALATAKIPTMLALVGEFEEAEEPLVVFSAYRAPIDLLSERPGWAAITGDTSNEKRGEIVEAFQAGRLKGVACTIRAGGVAITLTRASNVLRVDRELTPALNSQAEDRIYRIGQERPVLITDLVAAHPLDQRISELLGEKAELIAASVDAATVQHQAPVVEAPIDWQALEDEAAVAGREARAAAEAMAAASDEREREFARIQGERALGRVREKVRASVGRRLGIAEEPENAARRGPASDLEAWAADGVQVLAELDPDRAREQNGMGFSASDGGLGHAFAAMVAMGMGLTDGEWRTLTEMLGKYRGQIGAKPRERRVKKEEKKIQPEGLLRGDWRGRDVVIVCGRPMILVERREPGQDSDPSETFDRFSRELGLPRLDTAGDLEWEAIPGRAGWSYAIFSGLDEATEEAIREDSSFMPEIAPEFREKSSIANARRRVEVKKAARTKVWWAAGSPVPVPRATTQESAAPPHEEESSVSPTEEDPEHDNRPPAEMTRAEREAEIDRIRRDPENRAALATPLLSEGSISPMQVGMMSDRQRAKYQALAQLRMEIESRTRELARSDEDLAAEAERERGRDVAARRSAHESRIRLLREVGVSRKTGKLRPSYQAMIDREQAALDALSEAKRAAPREEVDPARVRALREFLDAAGFEPDEATATRIAQSGIDPMGLAIMLDRSAETWIAQLSLQKKNRLAERQEARMEKKSESYAGFPPPPWASTDKVVRVKSGARVQMESAHHAKEGTLGIVETFSKAGRWFWQVSFYGPDSWGNFILAEKEDFAKFAPVADDNPAAVELRKRAASARAQAEENKIEAERRLRDLVREETIQPTEQQTMTTTIEDEDLERLHADLVAAGVPVTVGSLVVQAIARDEPEFARRYDLKPAERLTAEQVIARVEAGLPREFPGRDKTHERTPGYNHRLQIGLSTDKNGKPIAYRWSGTGFPGNPVDGQWIRMSFDEARLLLDQEQADRVPYESKAEVLEALRGEGGATGEDVGGEPVEELAKPAQEIEAEEHEIDRLLALTPDEGDLAAALEVEDEVKAAEAGGELPTSDVRRGVGRADYEERREARIERLQKAGERLCGQAAALWAHERRLGSAIPFGQPILIGHHSEKRDRNFRERLNQMTRKGIELDKLGKHYLSLAESAESNRAISSDDPEAPRKLQAKIDRLTQRQERGKLINKAIRSVARKYEKAIDAISPADDARVEKKSDIRDAWASDAVLANLQAFIDLGWTDQGALLREVRGYLDPDFAGRIGVPDYANSNNAANLRRLKERLVTLEKQGAEAPKDPITIGNVEVREEDNRVQITFPDRVPRDVFETLRNHAFKVGPSYGKNTFVRMASPGVWEHAVELVQGFHAKASLAQQRGEAQKAAAGRGELVAATALKAGMLVEAQSGVWKPVRYVSVGNKYNVDKGKIEVTIDEPEEYPPPRVVVDASAQVLVMPTDATPEELSAATAAREAVEAQAKLAEEEARRAEIAEREARYAQAEARKRDELATKLRAEGKIRAKHGTSDFEALWSLAFTRDEATKEALHPTLRGGVVTTTKDPKAHTIAVFSWAPIATIATPAPEDTAVRRVPTAAYKGPEPEAAVAIAAPQSEAPPGPMTPDELARIHEENATEYFPTRDDVARRAVGLLDLEPGMSVLEPEAGRGALARVAAEAGGVPVCVELLPDFCAGLRAMGFQVREGDFLAMGRADLAGDTDGFDRVLMNPPFSKYQDVAHVEHAYEMLAPGGILVAIMSPGALSHPTKRAEGFRAFVEGLGGEVQKLEAGSFKESGTGASAVIVKLRKPGAARRRLRVEAPKLTEDQYVLAHPRMVEVSRCAAAASASAAQKALRSGGTKDTEWQRAAEARDEVEREVRNEYRAKHGLPPIPAPQAAEAPDEAEVAILALELEIADAEKSAAEVQEDAGEVAAEEEAVAGGEETERKFRTGRADYEARRQRRIDRLTAAGERLVGLSERMEQQSSDLSQRFAMGQPILVGHHSEKRARKDQEKMLKLLEKWPAIKKQGEEYLRLAGAAESNRAISSDDPRAIEKIRAEIASLKDSQQFMRDLNEIVRKAGKPFVAALEAGRRGFREDAPEIRAIRTQLEAIPPDRSEGFKRDPASEVTIGGITAWRSRDGGFHGHGIVTRNDRDGATAESVAIQMRSAQLAVETGVKTYDREQRFEASTEAADLRNAWVEAVKKLALERNVVVAESVIRSIVKPDFMGRAGVASYLLSNNSANIRRLEGRLEALEKAAASGGHEPRKFGDAEVREEENRVQIVFPGRVARSVYDELKGNGFKVTREGIFQRMASPGVWELACRIAASVEAGAEAGEARAEAAAAAGGKGQFYPVPQVPRGARIFTLGAWQTVRYVEAGTRWNHAGKGKSLIRYGEGGGYLTADTTARIYAIPPGVDFDPETERIALEAAEAGARAREAEIAGEAKSAEEAQRAEQAAARTRAIALRLKSEAEIRIKADSDEARAVNALLEKQKVGEAIPELAGFTIGVRRDRKTATMFFVSLVPETEAAREVAEREAAAAWVLEELRTRGTVRVKLDSPEAIGAGAIQRRIRNGEDLGGELTVGADPQGKRDWRLVTWKAREQPAQAPAPAPQIQETSEENRAPAPAPRPRKPVAPPPELAESIRRVRALAAAGLLGGTS